MEENKTNDILSGLETIIPTQEDEILNIPLEQANNEEIIILDEAVISSEMTPIESCEFQEVIPETIAEIKNEDTVTQKHSIIKTIGFFLKYVSTSAMIFGVLMVTTNYSAYLNIIKSYIFEERFQAESQLLINSVEASNIKEKIVEEVEEQEEKDFSEDVNIHSIKKLITNTTHNELGVNIEITPYENRIVIPKIGKNIPLLDIKNQVIEGEQELNNIFMKELENGVIRYPGSAKPGQDGSAFIFGHSSNFPWAQGEFNDVFSLLDKVSFNDEIIVYYGQKKHTYRIRDKKVITPGDVSVLQQGDKDISEITLMTCWPIGTTLNRLIVRGELVEE